MMRIKYRRLRNKQLFIKGLVEVHSFMFVDYLNQKLCEILTKKMILIEKSPQWLWYLTKVCSKVCGILFLRGKEFKIERIKNKNRIIFNFWVPSDALLFTVIVELVGKSRVRSLFKSKIQYISRKNFKILIFVWAEIWTDHSTSANRPVGCGEHRNAVWE